VTVPCAKCQRPYNQAHHPTAKDHLGAYLDRDFTVPLCHNHHTVVTNDAYTLGLQVVTYDLTYFDRNLYRLLRTAATFARFDPDAPAPIDCGTFHRLTTRWAEDQRRGVRILDEIYSQWRSSPRCFPKSG
jgi:hypothetical protein